MKWIHPGTRNWGMLLMAIWLIITGLNPFVHLAFLNVSLISALLAVVAGGLLLAGR